jgi:hypothetical protein
MAAKSPTRAKKSSAAAKPSGRIEGLAPDTANVVRRATDVLETELSSGLGAAEKTQRRFREQKKVDVADLQDAITRFREDGHAVVNLARSVTTELRSESTNALTQRLFEDADRAVDLALAMVEMAPDLLNRLVEVTGVGKTPPPPKKGS